MLTVAIIGAGQFGCGLQPNLHSYASAIKEHSNFKLAAIVDTNLDALEQACSLWAAPGYQNVSELRSLQLDVIVISTPDAAHEYYLEKIIHFPPKIVVIEKPSGINPIKLCDLLALYWEKNIRILVNYSRRYLPVYHQLAMLFNYEKVISTSICYAKGIFHNGCHAIDLIHFLFGNILSWQVLSSHVDFNEQDPSVSAYLKAEKCSSIFLRALDESCFTHFEVDIFTQSKRFIIKDDHSLLVSYEVQPNQGVPSGNRLILREETKIPHGKAILYLLDNIVEILANQKKPFCSVLDAIQAEKISIDMQHQGLAML